MLASHAVNDDWVTTDFDTRIRSATILVRESEEAKEDLSRYRHLILDEVQDFVGDRAEFVKAILEGLAEGAGFTLPGDPAQGIYDFQLKDSTSRLSAGKAVPLGCVDLYHRQPCFP